MQFNVSNLSYKNEEFTVWCYTFMYLAILQTNVILRWMLMTNVDR